PSVCPSDCTSHRFGKIIARPARRFHAARFAIIALAGGVTCLVAACSHEGDSQIATETTSPAATIPEESVPAATPGVEIHPSEAFQQAVDQVVDAKGDGLHIERFVVQDEMLDFLDRVPQLQTLLIDRGEISDVGVAKIAALPKLRHLRLRQSPLTDIGVSELAKCKTLWFLNLPQTDCTAEGIAMLAELPELQNLRLGSADPNSAKLGNDVCDAIASIKTLRSVHLINVPVNDDGLRKLASLPELESLYLDNAAVTQSGWDWLFKEHPDLHIHVDQSHHDRDPSPHRHDEP
ncbi:MAG: hypothetical protein HKN47_16955, partial [Pirellulaceae bacterium]|nr:hypothetical protein [Pirellulaceae bacterium]